MSSAETGSSAMRTRGAGRARGHRDALALATRERSGVLPRARRVDAHVGEDLAHAGTSRLTARNPQGVQWFGDGRTDCHARIQGREWVLEDRLDAAAQRAHRGCRGGADGLAVQQHLARARREKPEKHTGERRLAAARLADERNGLARAHLDAHIVQASVAARVAEGDAAGAQDWLTHGRSLRYRSTRQAPPRAPPPRQGRGRAGSRGGRRRYARTRSRVRARRTRWSAPNRRACPVPCG